MKQFAVVYESEDIIELVYVSKNGYEAIGHLICHMEDRIQDIKNDGEEFERVNVFDSLEMDTGYCWSIKTKYGLETWYILDKTVEEKDL